MGFLFSSGPCG